MECPPAFYLDLVRFGGFNQKYGSKVADDIMKAYVKSLCDFTSDEELIGRLGGNYFIALISKTKRDAFLRKIIECEVEVEIGKKIEKIKISAKCGGYSIDDNNITGMKILDYTEIALNFAKHTYKIPFLFLTPEIQNEIYENKKREKQILKSIENKDFCVYYQPKINCRETSICGAEALARWNLDGNILEPAVFIPVLEQNGAICRIDFLILEKVCGDIKIWEEKGLKIPRVSVNFSRKNLGNKNLAADIYDVIKKYDVKADNIEIEITEKLDEYSIETH